MLCDKTNSLFLILFEITFWFYKVQYYTVLYSESKYTLEQFCVGIFGVEDGGPEWWTGWINGVSIQLKGKKWIGRKVFELQGWSCYKLNLYLKAPCMLDVRRLIDKSAINQLST